MPFYAKTYYSTNGWTGPQNLSNFGQEIAPNITLGYEEFNFIKPLEEKKLLYIPCFSYPRTENLAEVYLFYHVPNKGPMSYAKVSGLRQLHESEIMEIRKSLEKELPDQVKNLIDSSNGVFNTPEIKQKAFEFWSSNFAHDNILSAGKEPRFIVNTKYEKIDFIEKNQPVNPNWKRAKFLYKA